MKIHTLKDVDGPKWLQPVLSLFSLDERPLSIFIILILYVYIKNSNKDGCSQLGSSTSFKAWIFRSC